MSENFFLEMICLYLLQRMALKRLARDSTIHEYINRLALVLILFIVINICTMFLSYTSYFIIDSVKVLF